MSVRSIINSRFWASFLVLTGVILIIVACEKEELSDPIPPPTVISTSFIEEFDTVGNLEKKGWVIFNNSSPYGSVGWRQGKYELGGKYGNDIVGFPAFSAVYNQNEFVSADLNAGSGTSTISCWLITKVIPVKNGDELSFYTRTHGDFPDRLQVRANFTSSSIDINRGPNDVGDFSRILLDINPSLILKDYPNKWTKYTIPITGLNSTVNARFAFHYYVTNGGPNGTNSDMIGIDQMEFKSK